jgi:hypothetical protein
MPRNTIALADNIFGAHFWFAPSKRGEIGESAGKNSGSSGAAECNGRNVF